ncbi:3-keto-disaccharide hydrolase [Armatimonas rosea]|uniref:3-keto-alpha-glucoside-1,2-lyase/3-keto-2-hydroxy-glucal hydratase domain-containing protein n=1 Tax=Armatimonas rosea TaxID=685828 RepID=A0A7W9SMA8_ARMRO|nr:DUF1080 domain-containing protein [Armatimonas rosea]MBB6049272.1 hypothetical protein [Armatimonas rosea]
MKTTTILAALPLTMFLAASAQAKPPFAQKEGVKCTYCHSGQQPKRNYRGDYYKLHNLTFEGFDDAAEAKKAGVEIGPLADSKPASLTAPKPVVKLNAVYPGTGTLAFGDGPDGVVKDGKPVAKGWKSLFNGKDLKGFTWEKGYWSVVDGVIVGDKKGNTPHHHYLFTDQDYSDFEMHVDVKMTGYNSGVCPRVQPKSFDDVPGYQVDMGDGFWGCLWDEHHRQKKIFDFPTELQNQLVKQGDWNHYYFKMVGTHITIYLNGVKTAEGDDPDGFKSGPIAFQLCHGPNTVASFKNLYIKPLAKPTKGTAPKSDENPKP